MLPLIPQDPDALGYLGRGLREDKGGTLLADYRNCFEAAALNAKRSLHNPLSREEFEFNRALENCTTTALAVIKASWEAMHP